MRITDEMLKAGASKAAELGLLPRRFQVEDLATNAELIQEILDAALTAASMSEQKDVCT